MPDVNATRHDEPAENDGERDLHDLGRDQDFPLVVSVGGRASDHGERECGQARREIHHPEHDGFVRKRAHHPALRHHLHPGAGVRNRRTDDVTAKWTRLQQSKRFVVKRRFSIAHRMHS